MALRVWLPLNGTLENKGISDVTFGNSNTSFIIVDNNGKIGKCYTFNSTANNYGIWTSDKGFMDKYINHKSWSLCAWVKTSSSDTCIMSLSYGLRMFAGNSTLVHLDNVSRTITCYSSVAVNDGKWHHLTATYNVNTNKIKIYVDGENTGNADYLTGDTYASSWTNGIFIGKDPNDSKVNDHYLYSGSLNDIRIYDHALSPLEVKEISQGLILHYKLDGFSGGVGENLLSKYVSPGQNGPKSTTTAGRTNYYGDYGITIPAAENADTYFRLWLDQPLEANEIYTISCNVSGLLPGTYYNFPLFAQSNTAMGILQLNKNGICSLTFTMTYSTQNPTTVDGRTVYVCFMDDSGRTIASGQGPITITNFKIEKGSNVTPFCKSLTDLGVNSSTIRDNSGYGNDGEITGTLETEQNNTEGRYQIATKFPTNSCYIKLPAITYSNFGSSYTFTWWEYMTTVSGGPMPWGFSNGNRLNCYHTTNLCWNTGDGGSNPFTPAKTAASLVDNKWHFMAITGDGTNVNLYVDGTYVAKATTWKPLTGTQIYISGWDTGTSYSMVGNKMSDFRIYATILNAENIATLYHTSAQVNNLGGVHGFEMVEDVSGRELLALPWTSSYTTHNKTSISTNYNSKHEWYSNVSSSASSDYIKINPTGKTYYWDTEISIAAGNQFYIGFERYDKDKTARSNSACVYVIATKPSADITHQRYFGTVNLATDGVNPTDTITLRILNAWSGTDSSSTKEATIHYLSLREVTGTPQTGKIKKQGQIYTDEFVEREKQASIYQNGIVGGHGFIEK